MKKISITKEGIVILILNVLFIFSIVYFFEYFHNKDLQFQRFYYLKKVDINRSIVVDKETGYEYFSTNGIVGGAVLDENGKPVKYEGGF